MNVFLTAYCALCLVAGAQCQRPFFRPRPTTNHFRPTADAGEPVILTPLIKAGKISEARDRSEVSLLPNIKGNAGFLTVDPKFNSNLYFWFFKKTGAAWAAAPLIMWLQGGPGCSSMFGLFAENGPFFVKNSTLKRRRYAWTSRYNVLYIDQPVGTGFSYTDEGGYVSTQEEVGQHLYEALTQFYKLFPELVKNKFYISGESYAGKYVPAIGYTIHRRNEEPKNGQIPLKGMFIGNGWSDPLNMNAYPEYVHRLGLIDYKKKREAEMIQEQVEVLIRGQHWLNATVVSEKLLDMLFDAMNFSSPYDYTQDGDDDFEYIEFLAKDGVRKAIHVGQRLFNDFSESVYKNLEADIMKSVKPWIEELLEHYPMCFFSGQLDIIVAYPLSENFLRNLQWSAADQYSTSERRIWRVGEHVAGYYKAAGNLVDALVRKASHMVPANQPRYALDLLVKFVEGKLK